MSESRRPPRRGRGRRPSNKADADTGDNPYRDDAGGAVGPETDVSTRGDGGSDATPRAERITATDAEPSSPPPAAAPPPAPTNDRQSDEMDNSGNSGNGADSPLPSFRNDANGGSPARGFQPSQNNPGRDRADRGDRGDRPDRGDGSFQDRRNGRRHRRGRGRGPRRDQPQQQQQQQQQQTQGPILVTATGEMRGWFDLARDAGFIRRPGNSYLAEAGDAYVPPNIVRQYGLRRADLVDATIGFDPRGRPTVVEVRTINDADPELVAKRPEFNSLPASYPERKLFMETGRPAKVGNELTRRAIDLIAPIGYGQRALIVAPARAGKTTLLHALTEGVAINHPNAALLILLVDERPEEVSEAISWGVGEVISSSFDQPAQRHVEVTDIVLNRAHRLVEGGKDVVIVLDSLTRMARAHNTAERGTGRTLSGGLDATAMAKPKAFFGSARSIPDTSGGGSLTIIATALVETGSRMDDVIFEEFKGTGNCEIKLDRSLAEKRIYPAIDIGTSGTRREEKLFRPDQIDSVFTLRRGLSQMPPQSAMEWLIKRIAATPSNDALLAGL
jgi:transcription termination factor Rho